MKGGGVSGDPFPGEGDGDGGLAREPGKRGDYRPVCLHRRPGENASTSRLPGYTPGRPPGTGKEWWMTEPIVLTGDEQRILGVLIEKGLCTPQYYPLTLNALVSGCNQKSNRDPVVEMVEDEIDEILLGLHSRAMVSQVYGAGSRAGKWRQELTSMLELDGPMMAVLGELFLRGPQTLGELRTRASRMKPIADLAMLEGVLALMAAHSPTLAMRLTPQGVRRGVRWCHCLQSEALLSQLRLAEESGVDASPSSAASPRRSSGRLEEMAEEIEILRKRVDNLEKSLGVIPATSGETSP